MSFANMARSPEVRKRLLQEAIPYQLIRIRESTSDPEYLLFNLCSHLS